jgi:hypothetical protein
VFKTIFAWIIRKLTADDRTIVINVNVGNPFQAPPAMPPAPLAQPVGPPAGLTDPADERRRRAADGLIELFERARRNG